MLPSVGIVGRYSNPRYPERTLAELENLVTLVNSAEDAPALRRSTSIRDVARRLGQEQVGQLIHDYESGAESTELMTKYGLSKASVLKLLKTNGVEMRRQAMTPGQLESAISLYENGMALVTISKQVRAPRETVRRALVDAGVALRPRGRPSTSD
jgi:hypothetical protein